MINLNRVIYLQKRKCQALPDEAHHPNEIIRLFSLSRASAAKKIINYAQKFCNECST